MVVLRRTRLVTFKKRSQFLWVCLVRQPFEFAVAQRAIERAADQLAPIIVVCIGAITTLGGNANKTFTSVGSAISVSSS